MTASPDDRTAQVDETEIAPVKAPAKRAPRKKPASEAAPSAEKTSRTPAEKPPVKKPPVKKPATARTPADPGAAKRTPAKPAAAKTGAAKAAAEKAAPTADVVVEPLVKALMDESSKKSSSTAGAARTNAAARSAATKNTVARSAATKSAASTTAAAARTATARAAGAESSASTAAKSTAAKSAAAKTAAAKAAAAKAAAAKSAAAKSTARSEAAKTTTAKTTAAKAAAAKTAAAKKAAAKAAADEAAKAEAEATPRGEQASTVQPVPVLEVAAVERPVVVESVPAPDTSHSVDPAPVAESVSAPEPVAAPVDAEPVEVVEAEPVEAVEVVEVVEPVVESDDAASDAVGPIEGPSGSEAISIRGLVKQFGDNRAVDGIDLTVPAGSFYGVVGPNGAGKTTTLSIVAGLLRADEGRVVICGIDQAKQPQAAKRLMGVLPDRLRTFDRLTGRQLLFYYGLLRGLAADVIEKRAADLARAFDLGDALSRVVSDYSAGMTKKIMLAGAMIHSPRVLVLDEPFESVDPVSSAVILDILRAYVSHGGTVILSSHGMDLVERVCSRVAIIVGGEVLAEGTIDEVRAGQTLEARFVELAGSTGEVEGLEWLHTFSD
ncbi:MULTISPECIES: ABC transporter ATP-binding protein [unclassified Microbacterium]|uniref:ABC transporter ATP-binding protein n=1 Tax=unclassified Microbacterium TaxID=2609290 RepID=UPI0021587320|nr:MULTISPECIES: ABC transporter ATP-binding protein [unclassified Microbacterium]